jgi:hypothetical protein
MTVGDGKSRFTRACRKQRAFTWCDILPTVAQERLVTTLRRVRGTHALAKAGPPIYTVRLNGELLHLPIVLAHPVPHGVTAMPGGIVPDPQQRREALGRKSGGAARQKIDGHRTHGSPGPLPLDEMICAGRMGVIMGRTIVLSSLPR